MEREQNSFGQILKSSVFMGGAQLIVQLIGILRMKIIALLIGPIGIGLQGVFSSGTTLVRDISGLGIRSSAVRDIAEAHASGDSQKLAAAILTVRRLTFLCGGIGTIIFAGLAIPLSLWSFGNREYAWSFLILSPSLFFMALNGGQQAILQGTRRIAELGHRLVLSMVLTTLLAIVLYALWGIQSVVWVLLFNSIVDYGTTEILVRKLRFEKVTVPWYETFCEGRGMVMLGIALMSSLFLSSLGIYVSKAMIIRTIGITGLGWYQAAYTITFMISGMVGSAMVSDFYPRLVGVSTSPEKTNELINDQLEVLLLLSIPVFLGINLFAWILIPLLYSSDFQPAIPLCLGFLFSCLLAQIVTPIAYLQVVKKKCKTCIAAEVLLLVCYVPLCYAGLKYFGISGAVYALIAREIIHYLFFRLLAIKVFHMRAFCLFLFAGVLFLLGVGILLGKIPNPFVRIALSGLLECSIGYFCVARLFARLGPENRWTRVWRKCHGA